MNNTKSIWSAIVVVAVIAIIGIFSPAGQQAAGALGFGAQTNFTDVKVQSSLQVGVNGTQLARVNAGFCSFLSTTTVTANQAAVFSCAAPGVEPGDGAEMQFAVASTTATSTGQWDIEGSQASSTPGFLMFTVFNAGTATSIPAPLLAPNSIAYQVSGGTQ